MCPDCHHYPHVPNQCPLDNCGESEVICSPHGPGVLSVPGKGRSPHKPPSHADEEEIRQLYAGGKSMREVEKLVGRSHTVVSRICRPIARDRITAMRAVRTTSRRKL
jgi:hypothetical protein